MTSLSSDGFAWGVGVGLYAILIIASAEAFGPTR